MDATAMILYLIRSSKKTVGFQETITYPIPAVVGAPMVFSQSLGILVDDSRCFCLVFQ